MESLYDKLNMTDMAMESLNETAYQHGRLESGGHGILLSSHHHPSWRGGNTPSCTLGIPNITTRLHSPNREVQTVLRNIITPIICILGFLGNVVNIIVLSRLRLLREPWSTWLWDAPGADRSGRVRHVVLSLHVPAVPRVWILPPSSAKWTSAGSTRYEVTCRSIFLSLLPCGVGDRVTHSYILLWSHWYLYVSSGFKSQSGFIVEVNVMNSPWDAPSANLLTVCILGPLPHT